MRRILDVWLREAMYMVSLVSENFDLFSITLDASRVTMPEFTVAKNDSVQVW